MSESRVPSRKRWFLYALLGAAIATGCGGWFARDTLQTCYYIHQLQSTPEDQHEPIIGQLVAIGEPAVPRLLGCLRKENPALCASARVALERLLASWQPNDPRCVAMADRFFESHSRFSGAGQIAALQFLPLLLDRTGMDSTARGRTIVTSALHEQDPEQRCIAIAVATRPDLNLLTLVVPLLNDPEAAVRRKAMLILGPVRETASGREQPLVSADELLKWLHDPDPEVRLACEMSLKTRDLSDLQIYHGRQATHPNPMERLKLILDLPYDDSVDLGVWLMKLSRDPDESVRAAAARSSAERGVLFDRLQQMSQTDPDGSVRIIAEYYHRKVAQARQRLE